MCVLCKSVCHTLTLLYVNAVFVWAGGWMAESVLTSGCACKTGYIHM